MTPLHCTCGQTELVLSGAPILSVECCCTSCRTAAERLNLLPGGAIPLGPQGQTHFVLYRKDRVTPPDAGLLVAFRLTPQSTTRRILSACCHTPLFLEFKGGHWISLYAALWPKGTTPKATLRTMTSDLPAPQTLPHDIPNARTQNSRFIWALLRAWVEMGFRSPPIPTKGEIDG